LIRDAFKRCSGLCRITLHLFNALTFKEHRFSDIYIQEVSTTSGFVLLIVLEVIPLNLPPPQV
jgi:hypothetical protein